jgi:hypothetical protein
MALKHRGKYLAAGILAGALLGAGLTAVTPAGAAVQGAAAAIDWKQVWKNEIKPRADKRYYTKKQSNANYYTKAQVASLLSPYVDTPELMGALAGYYTKAQSDANYYTKTQSDTNYYTKPQSDAKYAPNAPVLRGSWMLVGANAYASAGISLGQGFSEAPTVRYVSIGEALPAGCSGSASTPNAAPGYLCVFESLNSIASAPNMCRSIIPVNCSPEIADAFGTTLYASFGALAEINGTWAARPMALAAPTLSGSASPAKSGGRLPVLR